LGGQGVRQDRPMHPDGMPRVDDRRLSAGNHHHDEDHGHPDRTQPCRVRIFTTDRLASGAGTNGLAIGKGRCSSEAATPDRGRDPRLQGATHVEASGMPARRRREPSSRKASISTRHDKNTFTDEITTIRPCVDPNVDDPHTNVRETKPTSLGPHKLKYL